MRESQSWKGGACFLVMCCLSFVMSGCPSQRSQSKAAGSKSVPGKNPYAEKTVEEWVRQFKKDTVKDYDSFVRGLDKKNAHTHYLVPALIKFLDEVDLNDKKVIPTLSTLGPIGMGSSHEKEVIGALCRAIKKDGPFVLQYACFSFHGVGPQGIEALPTLFEKLDKLPLKNRGMADFDAKRNLKVAIGYIGNNKEAVAFMRKAYLSKTPLIRQFAVVGMRHKSALPDVLGATRDPEEYVVAEALSGLYFQGHGKEVFGRLSDFFDRKDWLRDKAVQTVAMYGDEATPLLKEYCLNPKHSLLARSSAMWAFSKMNNENVGLETTKALIEILKKGDRKLQKQVPYALSIVDKTGVESLKRLTPLLLNKEVATLALAAIHKIHGGRPEIRASVRQTVLPVVVNFTSGDPVVAPMVLNLFYAMFEEGDANALVSGYVNGLGAEDKKAKMASAKYLFWSVQLCYGVKYAAKWKAIVNPHIKTVASHLDSEDDEFVALLLKVLAWYGPSAKPVLENIRSVKNRCVEERAQALKKIGG